MQDPNFLNPLTNPILLEIVKRFFWVFLAGFFLVLILKKFDLKNLWKGELGKRYLSWLFIGSILMVFIFLGGIPSLIFLSLIMSLALYELCKITKVPRAYLITLIIIAIGSIITTSFFTGKFYILPIFYFAIITGVAIKLNDKKGFFNSSISLYASIWIIFALCHFVLLGHLNNTIDNTKALLFLVAFAVPLADIGAYVFGKAFSKIKFLNKFKIANNISPNKIWAGILGDIIGAGIGIWIMYFTIGNYFSILQLVFLAILIGFFSVMGDLNESMVKRYFKVKDSSNILPGHGGILDRIDSILRVIVVVYYFALVAL
jgi:phosphatidate cytidylyltransferase